MRKRFKILVETYLGTESEITVQFNYPDLMGERKDNEFTSKKAATDFIKTSKALMFVQIVIIETYERTK